MRPGPLDFLACKEMMDLLVTMGKLVQQVQVVLWVPPEKKVSLERKENRVKLDNL